MFQDFPSPFEGLETQHLQEKYFRESLGLVVRMLWYTISILTTTFGWEGEAILFIHVAVLFCVFVGILEAKVLNCYMLAGTSRN